MTVLFRDAHGAEVFEAEMDVIPPKDSTVVIGEVRYAVMFVTFLFMPTGRGGGYDQQVNITLAVA